jgi:hypothetical protein
MGSEVNNPDGVEVSSVLPENRYKQEAPPALRTETLVITRHESKAAQNAIYLIAA